MFIIRHQHQRTPLPAGELILLGRGSNCDIHCVDPSTSRVHCRLLARDGKVFLTDAGSRWGTFVNGKRVQEAELTVGDEITIGETVLRLAVETDARATTLVPPGRERNIVEPEQFDVQPVIASPPVKPAPLPNAATKPFVPACYLGKRFLRYRPDELVANTKSGMTFRSEDTALQRDVALKLFRPELFRDESAQQRFLRGVRTMVSFRHANIVAMHDAGVHEGLFYTVCEYVEGASAAGLIQKIGVAGMLDWQTTLRIGIDICEALEEIHERGIVHRNIKPEHILIRDQDKRALLGDVTLAKAWDQSQLEQITTGGDVVGELAWQSPEQLGTGEPVDHRSDLYQLGLMLYALLTGKNPFTNANAGEVMNAILTNTPQSPKLVHLAVPDLLEDIVLRTLAKNPSQRQHNAMVLRKDLQRVLKYAG